MIQVSELKGYQSYKAFNAYHHLLMGMKMIPEYSSLSFEDFLAVLDEMTLEDKKKVVTNGVKFVNLEEDELQSMMSFCSDKNGVPYTKENMKNLGPDKITEIVVAVAMEIAKIKVDFVTEEEKKK